MRDVKSKMGKFIFTISAVFIIALLFFVFPSHASADEGLKDDVLAQVDDAVIVTAHQGQGAGDGVEPPAEKTSTPNQNDVAQQEDGQENKDHEPWGYVMDSKTKQPIAGALIILNEQDDKPEHERAFTTTDEDGSFYFEIDPEEDYTIKVSADGYETIEVPVDTQTFDIYLEPVNIDSEENALGENGENQDQENVEQDNVEEGNDEESDASEDNANNEDNNGEESGNPEDNVNDAEDNKDNDNNIEENTDDNGDQDEGEDDTRLDPAGESKEENPGHRPESGPHFYVDDEKHNFSGIQDAINAVGLQPINDNTIYVDEGIYTEDIVIDGSAISNIGGLVLKAIGPVTIEGNILIRNIIGFMLLGFDVKGSITLHNCEDVTIECTNLDDTLKIKVKGKVVNIKLDGAGGDDALQLSGQAGNGSIIVAGGNGDDHITIDFSKGNPIPKNGLIYDGGAGYDIISFINGSFNKIVYRPYNSHSGIIKFDGSLLEYRNIEPIYDITPADDVTFEGTPSDDIISIVDGQPYEGYNTIEIKSDDFENIIFANKKNVIIDGIDGDDLFNVGLTAPAGGLLSIIIRGGKGMDIIEILNDVNLTDVDVTLEAESIKIRNATVQGKNITLKAEVTYGGVNPFADVETHIILDSAALLASGNLYLTANSLQQKPAIESGILQLKKTIAKITVTDTQLEAGGDIIITSKAILDLELNGFVLPLEITVAVAHTQADVIVDGNSRLDAGNDISLNAIADITSVSLAHSLGLAGSVSFAVSVIESTALSLLQGHATARANGIITIIAQNTAKVDTLADGFAGSESSGGAATVAVSVVNSTTRAGIYQNASIIYSDSLDIKAEGRNDIRIAAQSAVKGATDCIKDIVKITDDEGNPIIDERIQQEICGIIDKIAEGLKDDEKGGDDKEGSGIQGAGALAYGYLSNNTEAGIHTTGSVKTNNTVDISAKALNNVELAASGMTSGGDVGIGAAIGILTGNSTNKAFIGDQTRIEAKDINISALSEDFDPEDPEDVDSTNKYSVSAYAGQGAENVGIGGALAINVIVSDTQAFIGKDAIIQLAGGDIVIISTNNNEITTSAEGAPDEEDESKLIEFLDAIKKKDKDDDDDEKPAVGIGSGIAITVAAIDTHSYIDDDANISGLKDLTLEAISENSVETEAGAGAEGGVAVAPVLALTVFVGQVSTKIGTGNTLVLDGDLIARAIQSSKNNTSASGESAGVNVGVGTAIAITVAVDSTESTTYRNINAGGAVTFSSQAVARSNTSSEAGVKGGDEEDEDDEDAEGIDKVLNKLLTFIKNYSKSKGVNDQKVPGKTPQSAETSEGKVTVAGAVALNIATSTVSAYIPENINITAGDEFTLSSANNVDAGAIADASTADSGIGVGVAVAINVANVSNKAYIGKGSIVKAKGVTVEAVTAEVDAEEEEGEDEEEGEGEEDGEEEKDAENTFTAQSISGAGAGNIGVAGSVAINVVVNDVLAYIDGNVTLTGGDAVIKASNASGSTANAGCDCKIEDGDEDGASVGVGASFATNVIENNILAYLGENAKLVGADNIYISSDLESNVETIATAGADPFTDVLGKEPSSEAKYSLDAAVALAIVTNRVKAYTASGSTIGADGDVEVTANSISNTVTRSEGNASGSKAAVGATVGLNVVTSDTEAAVRSNGTVGGALIVEASTAARDDVFAMATARGLSIERYVNKFKTTVDDILKGKFGDDSDKKKPKSAEALDKNGAKTAQTLDKNGGTSGEGSQSEQSVCVAAAVAVNATTHNVKAYAGGDSLEVGGPVSVKATSHTNFETLGTGATVTDGNGISVGVAISNIYNETSASLGSIKGDGKDVSIIAISSQNMADEYKSKLGSQAIAGAASGKDGKIGVAGALGIINSHAKTNAFIAPGARVLDVGKITIRAEETSKLAVRAWAATVTIGGQSKAGVGATFAIIYSNNKITAYIGKNAQVTGLALDIDAIKHRVDLTDFSIGFDFENNTLTEDIFEGLELANFLSSNNYYAEAIAGAASAGTMALSGAFVVVVFNNTTAAYIDDGAIVDISGSIDITGKSDVNAKAIGGSAAGAKKVGAELTTVNIINNDKVLAYIGKDAKVTADGNIKITADADQEFTIIAVSGAGAGNTGAVGVLTILLTQNQVKAFIGEGAEVKSSGEIAINAGNDTYTYIVAGGGSGGGTAGVGGSLAVLILLNDTMAYIDQKAIVDADRLITIKADANAFNITAVISGTSGGDAGVAASAAVKTVKSNTRAYIGQGARINTDPFYSSPNQAVELSATDTTTLVGISGTGAGGGSAGVGASADTNVIVKTVKAYIEDDEDGDGIDPAQVKAAKNIIISAVSSETVVSITAGFAGGGSAGVGGAVSIITSVNDVQAFIGKGAVVETNGSVAILAEDHLVLVMLVGSGAGGGSAGVGSSVGVSTIINSIKAYIG
ncbi:MAG TPA: hypothetical protein GXZ32_05610 [Clostridiales bacterium]|nr:hypothetical protein [Clostridiales bacterium]